MVLLQGSLILVQKYSTTVRIKLNNFWVNWAFCLSIQLQMKNESKLIQETINQINAQIKTKCLLMIQIISNFGLNFRVVSSPWHPARALA